MLRQLALGLSSLMLVTSGAAAAAGDVLTLEEALRLALTNNPRVENAGLDVEKVGDEVSATRTRQYPAFSTTLRGSRNFEDESFTIEQGALGNVGGTPIPNQTTELESKEDYSAQFEVEVRQPLTRLYSLGLNIDRLEVTQQISDQKLRSRQQSVARDVKQEYYSILKTQSAMEATQETIAFYGSLVEIVSNRVKERTALEYELLDTEARLAKARYDELQQDNELKNHKERLNALMGRDVNTPFTVTAVQGLPAPVTDQELAEAQALAQRPETQEARLRLSRAKLEERIKAADYIPDVDLTASYVRLANTDFIPDEYFFVGVTGRWEFFDWGRRSDELSRARRSVAEAKNSIREADHNVVADVNERLRDLQNAKSLVQVTAMAQKAAREKLRVTLNKYREQAALLDDLLKAESDLAQANSDHQEATLAVLTATADLEKALGEE